MTKQDPDSSSPYLTGQLLVAMPQMRDPRFARSVIYMCAHSADGAMGLVVNRRVLFVMTDTFYRVPGANVFFRLVGALPVAKGRMTWSTMRKAIALLRCGRSLVVFPEAFIPVYPSSAWAKAFAGWTDERAKAAFARLAEQAFEGVEEA